MIDSQLADVFGSIITGGIFLLIIAFVIRLLKKFSKKYDDYEDFTNEIQENGRTAIRKARERNEIHISERTNRFNKRALERAEERRERLYGKSDGEDFYDGRTDDLVDHLITDEETEQSKKTLSENLQECCDKASLYSDD